MFEGNQITLTTARDGLAWVYFRFVPSFFLVLHSDYLFCSIKYY